MYVRKVAAIDLLVPENGPTLLFLLGYCHATFPNKTPKSSEPLLTTKLSIQMTLKPSRPLCVPTETLSQSSDFLRTFFHPPQSTR